MQICTLIAGLIEAKHAIAVGSFTRAADHLADVLARLKYATDHPDIIDRGILEFATVAQQGIGAFNDMRALARDLHEKVTPSAPMPKAPIDKAGALNALRVRLANVADVAQADLVTFASILREEELSEAQDVIDLAQQILANHDTLRAGFQEAFEVDACQGSA